MQIQFHQTNPYSHFNNRFVGGAHRTTNDSSLHSRRRMMEAQDAAKETESVRVTISGEAMALARQAKAMERLEQYANAGAATETDGTETGEESREPVQLTDEEIYDELLNQVNIWGDKSYALRHHFDHQETARMAEKRAAALTEMQKLEEMQKSEISRLLHLRLLHLLELSLRSADCRGMRRRRQSRLPCSRRKSARRAPS